MTWRFRSHAAPMSAKSSRGWIELLDRYGCLGAYGRADQISYRFLTDELGELEAYGLILPTLFLCIVAFLLNVSAIAIGGHPARTNCRA